MPQLVVSTLSEHVGHAAALAGHAAALAGRGELGPIAPSGIAAAGPHPAPWLVERQSLPPHPFQNALSVPGMEPTTMSCPSMPLPARCGVRNPVFEL